MLNFASNILNSMLDAEKLYLCYYKFSILPILKFTILAVYLFCHMMTHFRLYSCLEM